MVGFIQLQSHYDNKLGFILHTLYQNKLQINKILKYKKNKKYKPTGRKHKRIS